VEEAANGRFNGNLSAPERPHLPLPDRGRSRHRPRRSRALAPVWLNRLGASYLRRPAPTRRTAVATSLG
jgi:hypothetical protein